MLLIKLPGLSAVASMSGNFLSDACDIGGLATAGARSEPDPSVAGPAAPAAQTDLVAILQEGASFPVRKHGGLRQGRRDNQGEILD